MSGALDELYQQIILEHNRHPRGWGAPEGADRRVARENPFCGDRVTVHLRTDGARVVAVGFEAQACAIAKASASMMTEAVRGRTVEDAQALFARFGRLLRGQPVDGELGELVALSGVADFPVRIACAELPWSALFEALAAAA
jgi:nitrogen fixation NifU-like protein